MSSTRLILLMAAAVSIYLYLDKSNDVRLVQPNGDYSYEGYQIESLEPFTLTGRVLSRKDYRSGRESNLSPTDLAMGWGEMQNSENTKAIDVSQRNRWFYWKTQQLPIPIGRLKSQMANIHIIPASEQVAANLREIDANDLVHLQGDLVSVSASDGWRWRSSLSRTDTGDGSCELLWLKRITQVH